MGFFVDSGPEGEAVTETFTCCHCQAIVEIDRKGDKFMCHACFKRVCVRCHADGRCRPFEKRCDDFEKRVREQESRRIFRRSMGID